MIIRDLEEEKDAKFDMSTMSFPDKFEGSLQKQLREVGEWMTDRTEKRFRLSGKDFVFNNLVPDLIFYI